MAGFGVSSQLACHGRAVLCPSQQPHCARPQIRLQRSHHKRPPCNASGASDGSLSSPQIRTELENQELVNQSVQDIPSGAPEASFHQAAPSVRQFPAIVFAALTLTQAFRIVAHAATYLLVDVRHGFFRKAKQTQQGLSQAQQTIQQAVVQPAQTISLAEIELKAAWARLQQHAIAGGDALMKMLHSLDKPSITLDKKWADMQEQLAGNKDVSDRLQTLFASSVESTQTVATMLAQSGGKLQHSYWTSPQTKKVIDQEEELRSVVFAQMLGATS